MPRKSKREFDFITGVSRDPENKLTVQKSLPLFALWRSDLTLAEFKILDTYLSRIDSRKPDRRAVLFEKGELEQILGVKKINLSELKERLKHLMGNVVEVNDATKTKSFRLVTLFETAEAVQDEYDGLWKIVLECTQTAMKYFFNIENLGYLRYKLRCITALTSRYSYILFVYLEANRFRKSWEVGLDELKHLLSCENEPTYMEFKRFNDRLLKRCHKELNEKTECHFIYEPVKKGRSVVAIRFTLETLPALEPIDPNQMTLFEEDAPSDQIKFLQDACCHSDTQTPEFNRLEMGQILEVLATMPDSKLPMNVPTGSIEFRRYHYLSERYAAMNRADAKKSIPIKDRFAYLLKMVKEDCK